MTDIQIKTQTLPVAYVGETYEGSIAHNASATAITACAVATGSLPPGLSIAADFVRITGTPTHAGSYSFTLTLTDTAGAVTSGTLTIVVTHGTPNEDDWHTGNVPLAAQYARMWPS